MKKLTQFTGALPFFLAVFLNSFVDLGHKIVIQNTIFKLYDGQTQVVLTAIVNALILIPYIVLLHPAGFISDKYQKTAVMRYSAWGAVAICIGITVSYYLGWFWIAFFMTFLLAVQSAFYSPAKYGYIKEAFGKNRLGEANAVVVAMTIVAILSGTFAYSILFESWFSIADTTKGDVLKTIAPIGFVLTLCAIIELVMMYRLPKQSPTGISERFNWQRYLTGRSTSGDLAPLKDSQTIRLSIIGLATFWGVGQVMLAAFPSFVKSEMAIDNTIIVQGILACSGIGIALGSIIAGRVSKNHIETGLLPIGAVGVALGLMLLPHLSSPYSAALTFLFIGTSGGLFIVPLNALIQFQASENALGKTLAASNWVQNLTMLFFLVVTATFATLNLESRSLLILIGFVALIGCFYTIYQLPQSLTRLMLTYFISRRYRIHVQGMKNIPAKGGVLLLGNHVSWIDWAIVQLASPRPVRFVMIRSIYNKWYLKWFFDLFGCIPIEQGSRSREALESVAEALNQGEVVCLFPEGTLSRTGHLTEFRKGYERASDMANDDVVIVPFYLRGLWGSQFSRSSDKLKKQSSGGRYRDIIVAFGHTIEKSTPADILKRRVLDLSISSWQEHIENQDTVAQQWVQTAKSRLHELAISDTLGVELSSLQSLVGAKIFARKIQRLSPEQNIGILLPTSAGGMLCNMACMLAGKTVVNLNYTSSMDTFVSAIKQAELSTIYTSKKFVKKLKSRNIDTDEIQRHAVFVYLEDLSEQSSKLEKISLLLLCKFLPTALLTPFLCRHQDTQANAAILFSSGSEGTPKGVVLSQKNILANTKQISDVLDMIDSDVFFANLPLFHAFGLTACQFMPLLEGIPVACHPDPTDALGSAKAIAKFQATIMVGTSTFLRLYVRNTKLHPLMLSSLRLVVSGAEKLQDEVRESFKLKFNKDILEGYGATEIAPVASVNLPDRFSTQDWKVQLGQKPGSVGMPLPGTSCKIVDPDTLKELATDEAGLILIGGSQVMRGYLNNEEKTREVLIELDGNRWYATGDKGYLDKDGFLFIQDRYSRFAKISGEMVGLGTVESAVYATLSDPEQEIVAVSLPDEKKGERIVLLTNQAIDGTQLREALLANGLSPLALPSDIITVEQIPKLASGKTDFATAKRLATQNDT